MDNQGVSVETVMTLDKINCSNPGCRAVMGRVIEIEGEERILIHNVLCRVWHGVCVVCGKEFHYQAKNLKKTTGGYGVRNFRDSKY